jgi:hypothetical protein
MDKLESLKRLDNNKLIDVVKNYRQYGYTDEMRTMAISILEERGVSKEELQLTGNFENHTYDVAEELYNSFNRNSKIAFIQYIVLILTDILLLVRGSEMFELITMLLFIAACIFYFTFLLKSFLNQSQFYQTIGQEYGSGGAFLYLFAGLPFYFMMYFYFRNQMKEKMTEIK